jgi:hypothetical protein
MFAAGWPVMLADRPLFLMWSADFNGMYFLLESSAPNRSELYPAESTLPLIGVN